MRLVTSSPGTKPVYRVFAYNAELLHVAGPFFPEFKLLTELQFAYNQLKLLDVSDYELTQVLAKVGIFTSSEVTTTSDGFTWARRSYCYCHGRRDATGPAGNSMIIVLFPDSDPHAKDQRYIAFYSIGWGTREVGQVAGEILSAISERAKWARLERLV